jgi:hypothetical protein
LSKLSLTEMAPQDIYHHLIETDPLYPYYLGRSYENAQRLYEGLVQCLQLYVLAMLPLFHKSYIVRLLWGVTVDLHGK